MKKIISVLALTSLFISIYAQIETVRAHKVKTRGNHANEQGVNGTSPIVFQ